MCLLAWAGLASAGDPLQYGVTTDDPWDRTQQQVEALSTLSQRPALRVVFDEFVAPAEYVTPLEPLGRAATIMGEILDSSAATLYDEAGYRVRVDRYLDTLWPLVDVWEIGNEVNGGWTGDPREQAARVAYAFDRIRERGGAGVPVALTLYENSDCLESGESDMFEWSRRYLSQHVRDGLDYVFVSWWPEDCQGSAPDWHEVFLRLGKLYPNAKLGIGETGAGNPAEKEDRAAWCYGLRIDHPRFIGGCFWWTFRQDMVLSDRRLWRLLDGAMAP